MNTQDREYALEPTTFHSMREAQELADTLEQNLNDRSMGAANVRPELVEMFSELVNNAAEHGMTEDGADAHVRYMPHRRNHAFDVVIADSGPRHPGHPGRQLGNATTGNRRRRHRPRRPGTGLGHWDPHQGNRPMDDCHRDEEAGPEAVDPIGLRSPHHVRRRQT